MSPTETEIESPAIALETIKELFKRSATFAAQPLMRDGIQCGWILVVYDAGRSFAEADVSYGAPKESANPKLLGEVLAARADMNRESQDEELSESVLR